VLGPLANGTPLSYGNSFQNGARIRRNSSTSIFNSIFMGWNDALFIDGARSVNKHQNDTLMYKNNLLAGNIRAVNASTSGGSNPSLTRSKIFANANDSLASAAGVLADPFNYSNPNFAPAVGSPALTGASFSGARISDPFFTPTSYRGALSPIADSNWTNCWCNFDPQNANYNSSPINNPGATANFTAPATSNTLKVDFVNSSSNATSYFWDFGVAASTTDTSSAMNPSFTFPANGKYTVTLTARSKCGNTTKSFEITINDVSILPVVDFTHAQDTANGSRSLSFTNTTVEKGLTISYTWKFGDGATANTKNATHTYTANGSYTVTLIASHIHGVDSISKTIKVIATSLDEKAPLINNFLVYPNPSRDNVLVDFFLNKSENVSISVLDLTGKEIIQIPASYLTAGKHTTPIITNNLSEGMYMVRISSLETTLTTRLVIIK
jgi:PKD repeat protein